MPPFAIRPDCDIFCTVIDNYGDIGVCWRLARQLAGEHGLTVRLWVDDLLSFQALCPQVDVRLAMQSACGVEVRRWDKHFFNADEYALEIIPGAIVIEAFGCPLPESFVTQMAQRDRCDPPPIWINLEYLSAEAWVSGCHTLPSPHPRLPLVKHFFFPGFTAETGGLLRERNLITRRQALMNDRVLQDEYWQKIGGQPAKDALRVSLFSYENPAITALLHAWEISSSPICCLLPVSRALPAVESFCCKTLRAGDIVQRGALEIRVLPFVEQSLYDPLLWVCDLNFVRGEDSFIRAQWAARPFVWHIYPQAEDAHLFKLNAFLERYCLGLDDTTQNVLCDFWLRWNTASEVSPTSIDWPALHKALPTLRQHAARWSAELAAQDDLATNLLRFCRT